MTFNTTAADLSSGGTATFSRVGGGTPFPVTIAGGPVPGAGTQTPDKGTATENFADEGTTVGTDGPADAGVYNVSVTGNTCTLPPGGGGTDTCPACFTVLSAGAVAVTSVSPSSLRPGAQGNIKIAGNNFERGVKIEFLFTDGSVDPLITATAPPTSDNTDSGTAAPDASTTQTQIQRRAKVDAADAPGKRGVRVTNLDGNSASCNDCFFVAGTPLSGMSPNGGVNDPGAAPVTVTFSGTNVVDGEPRLEFTGNPGGASRDSLTIIGTKQAPSNGTSMTATFDLRNAAPGPYQGVIRDESSGITNACEQPACPAFTVVQPSSRKPPTVAGLDRDPNTTGNQKDQPAGTTRTFNVLGTNFSKGVAITTTAAKVTVTGVEFVSPTLVRATIQAANDATAGDYNVTATLTDGTASSACTGCYTVTAAAPPTPTATATRSGTPSGCPTATSTASRSASATPTASATASATSSVTPTATGSATAAALPRMNVMASNTPTPSATASVSGSPTASASSSATTTPSASATSTPSASASSTATTTPSATASPTNSCGGETPLTISVSPRDIVPNQASTVQVRGAANRTVELWAYSRPSTTYNMVRSGTTNASGDISWTVTPGGNTRLYAHYAGASAASDSPSTVITVHTSLSLSAYRDGVRKYRFQGTNLPRRAGQLITLYRYATGPNLDQYCAPPAESDTGPQASSSCRAIIVSQAKTGSNNTWRIDRTFTGSGQFYFVVRTSQNINNGRGPGSRQS